MNWRAQLSNALRTTQEIDRALTLSEGERAGLVKLTREGGLPFTLTPHFLSLIDKDDADDPLRKQIVPHIDEFQQTHSLRRDPLGEEDHEAVPFLVHRYPDRVLLLATDRCASYCRFCTRKRTVGQGPTAQLSHLEKAFEYIEANPSVKEVIVSGGDALMFDDEKLERLLTTLRAIDSLDIIRIASRMLAFAPQRVTPALTKVLKKAAPVYFMAHFNHANEINEATERALGELSDAGVVVLNQTVLLKGVNDDARTLETLFRKLVRLRAQPYYLHQCDLAPGTAHFRVPLERAQTLVRTLRGSISGLCMPTFVIDIPGGFGKVPVEGIYETSRKEGFVTLEGFSKKRAEYPLD